jgi:serine/threonine protein kinase
MEYVPGRSIHTRLMEYGAFGDELVRKYTKQVLEGLVYLHENKIVHRDIKGANVLADSAGNVKLADFGASKRLQSIKSMMGGGHKSVHGTPYWMSPEAVNPGASNGPGGAQTFKSDIWSTAAMMVEMFTTKPPFWDCEPVAALFKIGAEAELDLRELIPDELPAEAKTFMARCFKKDPRLRPDASDLVEDAYFAGI